MRQAFEHGRTAYQHLQVGQVLQVLWEKALSLHGKQSQLSGLSDNYLRVRATGLSSWKNCIMPVRITAVEGDHLLGEILPISAHAMSN